MNYKIVIISCVVFCISPFAHAAPPADGRRRSGKQGSENNSPPVAKIFEVDENNRILRPWTKINANSETVLQDLDRIRLECTSDVQPVQWLYIGHGAPSLTSNVTFSRVKDRNGRASTEYVATALISPTKEHHTGKYICSSTDRFDPTTFLYIYVPGHSLFSSLNGQDIFLPKNDTKILFPCTVSNPDVIVTLEKSINNVLQRVKPSLLTYDPKRGFVADVGEFEDPEGVYVCTARYNNLVRGIEYTARYPSSMRREPSPENIESDKSQGKCEGEMKCGDNAHCERQNGQQRCVCNEHFKGDPTTECIAECHSHSDCPRNTVCFRDLKCRDPCIHSIRCGPGSLCRIENTFPVCYCPKNFVGDAKTTGCINSVQEDDPFAPLGLNQTFQCRTRKCGENALCSMERGREVCKCRDKFSGNPESGCETSCNSHDDCPDDLSCNTLLKCHSPCIHNIRCGSGASCTVVNHRPQCYCPRHTVGDPMKECTSGLQGDQAPPNTPVDPSPPTGKEAVKNKCRQDSECASHEKCMRPGTDKGKQCLDPCLTRRCGTGAVCKTDDHKTFCACKDGYEGDANRACQPIKYEEGAIEPLRQPGNMQDAPIIPEPTCLRPEECGPFSKCTVNKDGKQTCECLEGHTGDAPKCAPECERNADCATNQVCLRDTRLKFPYCAQKCGKKLCGANAACREANGLIPAECECPIGYGGDAYVQCKNLNDKIGQDCTMDQDCGPTLRCETKATSRKCVDPCVNFKCGETLECSVKDHQATCVCPAGYTGNPSIGCSKDMEFNITALTNEVPCGGLSCGPHSECRIENDKPTCGCRSYARGEPPSCYQECQTTSDCEQGLSCVQKQCRHSCSTCGINTKCLISRDPKQPSLCSCIEGFEGNPKRGCRPVTS